MEVKQLLELTPDHEEFDFEKFQEVTWPNATPEQKAHALRSGFDEEDKDQKYPPLFRSALIYGYSDLVQYLWDQALEDQKNAIKFGGKSARSAIWLSYSKDTWAKGNKSIRDQVVRNFNFMMQQYTPDEQAKFFEKPVNFITKHPVELLEAYWGYANDAQKKSMLLIYFEFIYEPTLGILWRGLRWSQGTTYPILFLLQRVFELKDDEVTEAYLFELERIENDNWWRPTKIVRDELIEFYNLQLLMLKSKTEDKEASICTHLLISLKDIIENPEEMSKEDAKIYTRGVTRNQHQYLKSVCELNGDILTSFVADVIEKDSEFADKLLKVSRLDNEFKPLLRAFHNQKSESGHVELLDQDVYDEPQLKTVDLRDDDVLIKDHFFRADGWGIRRASLLAGLFGDLKDKPESLQLSLNEIAGHARRHLNHDWNTTRAKAGREKYNQLVTLFDRLRLVEGDDRETRLTAARKLIADHLEETPKESSLLKNRGGFFGVYKSKSKFLNWAHFHHYSYGDRTAVSTTDHLLIKLYDEIDNLIDKGLETKGT